MNAKEKTACAGTQTVNAGNDKTGAVLMNPFLLYHNKRLVCI